MISESSEFQEKAFVKSEIAEEKRKSLLPILVILQTIAILILAGIIIYHNRDFFFSLSDKLKAVINKEDADDQATDLPANQNGDDEDESEQEPETSTTYTGETFTAQLPQGWTITESYDGKGTKYLEDGVAYKGFTGLSIKYNSKEVFTVQAADGFGIEACDPYAKFKDFYQSHLNKEMNNQQDIGETLQVKDFTNTSYSEFEWLNTTFRRINTTYYYDTQEGNNYFEPPCATQVLTLEGMMFSRADGTTSDAYFYGPTQQATVDELKMLDMVLNSMELKK